MRTVEILRALQKSHAKPKYFSAEYCDFVIRGVAGDQYDSVMEKYKMRQKELLTPYEEDHFFSMLEDCFEKLRDIVSKQNILFHNKKIETMPLPLFGTMNDNTYNARIIPAYDVPLVIFFQGLIKLTSGIVEIVSEEIYRIKKNVLTKVDEEKLTKRFIDLLFCFQLYEDAYAAQPMDLSGDADVDRVLLESEILNTVFLFLMSHEYAHSLLSHLDSSKTFAATIGNIDVNVFNTEWEQELEADKLAAEIVLMGKCVFDTFSIYLSIFIFHISAIHSDEVSDTHPPLNIRAKSIIDYIHRKKMKLNHENVDYVLGAKITEYERFIKYLSERGIEENEACQKFRIYYIRSFHYLKTTQKLLNILHKTRRKRHGIYF